MRRTTDVERRRRRQTVLDGRAPNRIRPIHKQCADAHRPEVVDRELEHRRQHLGITLRSARSDCSDPGVDGRFVVPAVAVPARNAERADDSNNPSGVALHDGGFESVGQNDEIALRTGRAIEDDPLVVIVEPTGCEQRLMIERLPGDLEPTRL
jgi:hypothetical protein